AEFGQDVKACALGQASASVVGSAILGSTRKQVETARDQLKAMLTEGGPVPDAPFDGLEVLQPARDFKNRHASILLALDATAEAMAEAERADCA
ncbi:MAG: iron-sulfur cluster assembly scaffold protein, partial [Pseudomonadota bacterium]